MKFKFFFVPAHHPETAEADLNAFLSNHAVLDVQRAFNPAASGPGWSLCVSYQERLASTPARGGRTADKIDYREVLNAEDFAVFAKARDLRAELAAKEGVPVYQVFTNKQLADMVTQRVRSASDLHKIPGVGDARVKRFGEAFIVLIAQSQSAGDTP